MRTAVALIACLLTGCDAMNYKFPSSGQSVDNAVVVAQTLQGNSLKPFAPSNLRGQRDSSGSLLIEWERASRIGPGLRPYTDVPIGEEREQYIVEIYDGSALKRSMNVMAGMAQAVVFVTHSTALSKYAHIDENTLSASGSDGTIDAKGLQQINETGAFIEGTLNATGEGAATLSLISPELSRKFSILVVPLTGAMYVQIGDGSLLEVADYTTGEDAIVRLVLSGSEVRFYRDYRGPGTAPLYISQVAPMFPLFPGATVATGSGGTVSVSKAFMNTSSPKTIYSANQQTEDFGSIESAIKVRVVQVSAIIGRGRYAEATL